MVEIMPQDPGEVLDLDWDSDWITLAFGTPALQQEVSINQKMRCSLARANRSVGEPACDDRGLQEAVS